MDAEEETPDDPASQTVYVNLVGTFGFPLDMLLYADDLESMGRGAKGRRGIPLSYLYLAALGYPFKWAKTRGGFRVEWLGMETEYPSYKLGLSLKRATWLVESGKAEARSFAQGLGRLGFASIALEWERPFLGPLHAWFRGSQALSRYRP